MKKAVKSSSHSTPVSISPLVLLGYRFGADVCNHLGDYRRILQLLKSFYLYNVLFPTTCSPFLDALERGICCHRNPHQTCSLSDLQGRQSCVSEAERPPIGDDNYDRFCILAAQ